MDCWSLGVVFAQLLSCVQGYRANRVAPSLAAAEASVASGADMTQAQRDELPLLREHFAHEEQRLRQPLFNSRASRDDLERMTQIVGNPQQGVWNSMLGNVGRTMQMGWQAVSGVIGRKAQQEPSASTLPATFPGVPANALQLLTALLKFDARERISALQALTLAPEDGSPPYFAGCDVEAMVARVQHAQNPCIDTQLQTIHRDRGTRLLQMREKFNEHMQFFAQRR